MRKYLKELYKRKDLLVYLVISGLKAQYRNTYLGYFWWILDPLLMGVVYYFLRVVILGMEGENVGAFLIIGLIAWHWIKKTVNSAISSISGKSKIIKQVYLPKAIFPFGAALTQTINFIFGLAVIAAFLVFYRIMPGIEILWLPVIMLVQFCFLSAIALIVAYLCMFIRDIDNVLSHIIRLWFWTTPVIWEAGRLPARYSYLVALNPASTILISYRNILMYGQEPLIGRLLLIGGVSLVVIVFMIRYYQLNEHKIIKAL